VKAIGSGTERSEMIASMKTNRYAANDKIQIAAIGFGGRGLYDIDQALKVPGVKLTAVADLYDGRLLRAKELHGKEIFTTRYYEEILTRPDVDAIFIAGTHHWNAAISVAALKAGKAVYCEKPMVHKLEEGPLVIKTQKETNTLFMVGSQRVSSIVYEKARDLIRSGAIGELNYVEAWWDRNSALGAWQYSIPPDASEKTVDWKRFLGNAPALPFDQTRMFRWRNYKDYSTGVAGDLFVHLFSGLHFILDTLGPERIAATGGLRFWKDGRDIPDILLGMYDYPATKTHPAFNLMLRTNFVDGSGGSTGFKFIGTEGMMSLDNSITIKKVKRSDPGYNIHSFSKETQERYLKEWKEKNPDKRKEMSDPELFEYKPPKDYNDMDDHMFFFFDALRRNKQVVEDATFGFRAAAPAILTHQAYYDKKTYYWDPILMKTK
jgi:predicted dehydrogenase